jgi:hypothetical protein
MDDLKINTEEELFDLETLITEGVDARVPIEIEFPNGKKAQALIRPISTGEFKTIYNSNPSELLVNVLEAGLMNKDGEPLSANLIEAMPVGLPAQITQQIFEISGIKTDDEELQETVKQLELFP